uniref:AAA+ ATPase domain-containing protein n=1 Tax=Biomphalaria glabrata TaxID=6526 RepID=A0A2C9M576_BIOGL
MNSDIQSVAYEDFLQDIKCNVKNINSPKRKISKNGNILDSIPKINNNKNDLSKSHPEVLELQSTNTFNKDKVGTSMSYTEFLSLFKPPPSARNVVAHDEETPSDSCMGSSNKVVKCRSITSYFSQAEGKVNKGGVTSSDTNKMTVTAQVHNSKLLSVAQGSTATSFKSRNVQNYLDVSKEADSIVLLSTETLEDSGDFVKSKKLSTMKRKNVDLQVQETKLKKPKFDILTEKNNTIKDAVHLNTNLDDSDSSEPSHGFNCSQSTLCFGKNGISLLKADKSGAKEQAQKQKFVADVKNGKNLIFSNDVKSTEADVVTTDAVLVMCNKKRPSQKTTLTHSLAENILTAHSVDDEEVKVVSVETPTLRRSSRIRQTPKILDNSVIEVDLESDDEAPRNIKKKKSHLPSNNTDVKPAGKLAPIFTQVKSKVVEVKKGQPAVDPETLRLRREFLMSGIPDELKRQINTAASAVVVSDYPPIPKISHIQQLKTIPSKAMTTKHLSFKKNDFQPIDDNCLLKSFTWEKIDTIDNPIVPKLFENFCSHPVISEIHVRKLLSKYQTLENSMCYEKLYRHWQSKLLATAQDQEPSKKLHEAEEIIVVDDTPPRSTKSDNKQILDVKDCLWTDFHQPDCTDHIVGNSGLIKQLKSWLEKWKSLLQKEDKNVSSKPVMKSKKTSTWSDDSDFTDSDEEENKLCNTMLITGPHGTGKTSSVYALAHELGFKVFEVNSSSLRSGKQLLSQLEEATQSHKVAQKKTETAVSEETIVKDTFPQKEPSKDKLKTKPKSTSKPHAASVANFFKSNIPSHMANDKLNKHKNNVKDEKKQMKNKETKCSDREKSASSPVEEICEQNPTSGHVNLSTVSLILFDEVDVVFEDDKGFLATVQYFMMSTKIPIIMTCTSSHFHNQLSAKFDSIFFKKPSRSSIARYLSTVCLSHGINVDTSSLSSLVDHLKGDIRKCLLSLQYWCESGGGRTTEDVDIDHDSVTLNSCENENNAKMKVLGRKKMVIDDEDCNHTVIQPIRHKFGIMAHKDIVETLLGLALKETFTPGTVFKLIDVHLSSYSKFSDAIQLIDIFNSVFSCNSLYQVALFRLALPKVQRPGVNLTESVKDTRSCKKTKKRILQSWFDSDSSSDSPDSNINNPIEVAHPVQNTDLSHQFNTPENMSAETSRAKDSKSKVTISILSEISRFYDSMSYVDCLEHFERLDVQATSPGMNDQELLLAHNKYSNLGDVFQPMGSAVSLLATRNMCRKVNEHANTWSEKTVPNHDSLADKQNSWPEEFHLPVGDVPNLSDDTQLNSSKNVVTKNILTNLGNIMFASDQKLNTDYLPFLREICKSEKERHLSKSQRRFQHYFNTIGLNLDQSTVDSLSSE